MPRRTNGPRPTLERKILFYRAHTGTNTAGEPRRVDMRPTLARIEALPFESGGRYLEVEQGQFLACWPQGTPRPPRAMLGRVRRLGLPQIERGGRFHQLRIQPTDGLVEAIHVVFFPNNIVGADFNFYGPRLSALGRYIDERAGGPPIEFHPLLRQDIAEQLRKLGELRLMRLRARRSIVDVIRQRDRSLADTFDALGDLGGTDDIEVVIRSGRHSRHPLAQRVVGMVQRLAGMEEVRNQASSFVVRGKNEETGSIEEVDILREHFMLSKQIVRLHERGRALDPESAFAVITNAYAELRDDLEAAVAVQADGHA